METFGNRLAVLEAVNFVESHFPNAQAPQPTLSSPPWRVPVPANSQAPQVGKLLSPPGIPSDKYYGGIPDGPPPGLVRVCPPIPVVPHLITNQDVSLFGDFARYLDTGVDEDGRPVIIDLTCMICQTCKLEVPERLSAAYSSHGPGNSEWIAVMPCGHFFGSACLTRWLRMSDCEDNGKGPLCPLCRFESTYSCGHYLPAREYNHTMLRRNQVPMTLPEGGSLPYACELCYEGELEATVDSLRDLLFPRYIPQGDLRWADSAEILRETSLQFKRRVFDFLIMKEHYLRW
ncbi:hypothetical protein HD806DRAFT_544339 [Xylariaceae sp. AK1471]|nr:hypothetical protein HD806DRAFT_544339 [Xylariaceae sp. AK1471]